MPNILETHCCGLGDLSDIQTDPDEMDFGEPEDWVCPSPADCVLAAMNGRVAFVTFAQATFRMGVTDSDDVKAFYKKANKAGERLARYIRKHKLGTVSGGKKLRNPHSGNDLKVWLWALDAAALEKWDKARLPKP